MKRWVVPVGVLAVLVLVGGALLVKNLVDSAATIAAQPTTQTTTPGPTPSPAGYVEVEDETGFAISYPKDWTRLESPDPQVRLIVARNDGDSFLVRVIKLDAPANVAALRELTDKVVTAGEGVELLAQPKQITIGGLDGYFYFYRFTDKESGRRGVHSHYFLLKSDAVISFVCQALPEESFRELAPVFDKIVSTFRIKASKGPAGQ